MLWGRRGAGRVVAIVSTLVVLVASPSPSPAQATNATALSPDSEIGTTATATGVAERIRPPARTFTVVATGDILTENAVLAAGARAARPGQRYDFAALFTPIAPIIASADLAICHVELPMGRPGDPPMNLGPSAYGGNRLVSPVEVAAGVAATGFDRCTTASNHSNDIGGAGIDQTLAGLDAAGVSHVGTARSVAEAAPDAQLFTLDGVRVAHLAYTRFSNTPLALAPWQLNYVANAGRVISDVFAARAAGADVVIVSVHLSQEMQTGPIPDDRAFVTALTAAAPVDVVIMHGPHVIQPTERVNGTLVYWSLGNLISGMGVPGTGRYEDHRTLDGLIAGVRFTESSPGLFTTESWPVAVCLDPATRIVHAGLAELADPATPPALRAVLQACVDRTRSLVPDVH